LKSVGKANYEDRIIHGAYGATSVLRAQCYQHACQTLQLINGRSNTDFYLATSSCDLCSAQQTAALPLQASAARCFVSSSKSMGMGTDEASSEGPKSRQDCYLQFGILKSCYLQVDQL
jgi:hypothetical protein